MCIRDRINDARGLLAVYIKSITDESEIKEATHLQREFSTLRDKVEQLKIKQESLKVDTDDKVDRQPTDSAGRAADGHDSAADKPLPDFQHFKNMVLPYLPVGGVFLAIALFITALVKCSGGDATEADAYARVDVVQNPRIYEKVDPAEFRKALEAHKFNYAYEMLKGKSDSIIRTAYLKTKIDDYLWTLVKAGDGAYAITEFFLNLNNAEMCQALGFVDNDHNDIHNGGEEWNARYENYHTLKELLDKEKPTSEQYNRAVQLANTLGHFNFTGQLAAMLEKVQKAEKAEARRKQTEELATEVSGNSEDLIVTCGGEQKDLGTSNNLGFEVYITNGDIGNKIIRVDSNNPLGYKELDGLQVNKESSKSYTLKVLKMQKKELKFIMTSEFMNKKGDKVQITITFIKEKK